MWNVFLWLNICFIAVFCQRNYIPHYSYYINSLLQPKREIASFHRLNRGIMPSDARYKNYFKYLYSHEQPCMNISQYLPNQQPPENIMANNADVFQTPKRFKKRYDVAQPENDLFPYVIKKPQAYFIYKGVAPIRLKTKIGKFFEPFQKTSQKVVDKAKDIFKLEHVKETDELPGDIYRCSSKHNNDSVMDSTSACPCSGNASFSPEKSTEPLAVNLFLPSQLIINNLQVCWPTPTPRDIKSDMSYTTSANQSELVKGSTFTKTPAPLPEGEVIVINISISEKPKIKINDMANSHLNSNLYNDPNDFMKKINISGGKKYRIPESSKSLNVGYPLAYSLDEEEMGTGTTQNLLESTAEEAEVFFEEDVNSLFYSTVSTCATELPQLPDGIISYLIEGLKYVSSQTTEAVTEMGGFATNDYKDAIKSKEKQDERLFNIANVSCDDKNTCCSYQIKLPYVRMHSNNCHIRNNAIGADDEKSLLRQKRRTNAWSWIKKRRKKKREFVSSEESCQKNSDLRNVVPDTEKEYYKTSQDVKEYKSDMQHSKLKKYIGETKKLSQPETYHQKRVFISSNENQSSHQTKQLTTTIAFTNMTTRTLPQTLPPKKDTTTDFQLALDTGNRHPSKLECEQATNTDCICCLQTAVTDLGAIATNLPGTNEISTYSCSDYRPLNASYTLSSDLKPRLITKKLKELIPDNKNGPKEITKDTFQEVLSRGVPNEGVDFYVFPSASVSIPCFTRDDIQLSPNTADSAKYEWSHGDDRPITEGRVTEDVDHKGMLQIKGATGLESDSYKCTVSYINPDTDQTVQKTFIHSLFVVQLPKVVLQTPLHYGAPVKCDQETLEMFELYLPQQVEELVCSCDGPTGRACALEIHDPLCQGKVFQVKKKDPKLIWHLESSPNKLQDETSEGPEDAKMEMSLNYQVDISDVSDLIKTGANKTTCNPFCQLKILLKLADIIRDSLAVALSHPVKSGTGVTFTPDLLSMNMKVLIACEGGLQIYQGFCIPCPLHTFSEEGSTGCTPCPDGTYQPHIGSKKCERCTSPFEPGCLSLIFEPLFMIWIVIGGVVILLIMVIIYRKLCRPKKKHKGSLQTDSSRIRRIKDRKFKHKKYSYSSDDSIEPPSLPSEDFTG